MVSVIIRLKHPYALMFFHICLLTCAVSNSAKCCNTCLILDPLVWSWLRTQVVAQASTGQQPAGKRQILGTHIERRAAGMEGPRPLSSGPLPSFASLVLFDQWEKSHRPSLLKDQLPSNDVQLY